jgi:hypothetical protein
MKWCGMNSEWHHTDPHRSWLTHIDDATLSLISWWQRWQKALETNHRIIYVKLQFHSILTPFFFLWCSHVSLCTFQSLSNLTWLAAVANFLTGALAKCAQSRSILDYCNCDGQNDFLARFHALASFPVVPWHRSLSRRAIVSFGRERQRPWIFARKDSGTKYGHSGCSAGKSKCFFCSLFGPVLWRQIFQRAS